MSGRREWTYVAGAAVLLLVGVLIAMKTLAPAVPTATIGGSAPAFEAQLVPGPTDSIGETPQATPASRSLADYEGRVVLLNFWATWCEPCKVEMPSMEALHRDYAPHGLDVVAVSEDDARVSVGDLRAYADDLGLSFDILRDTTHDVARAYQVLGYPTTFVIARDGTIRRRWIGPEDWNSQSNRAFMRQLLGIEQAGDE
jgi:cytochrome c biogenesis protein CcmG/thiol:disulfide interchange protein DsbE